VPGPTTYEMTLPVWPLEDRPEIYRNEAYINSHSTDTVLALMKCWYEKQKKEERGDDSFKKDPQLPTRHYDAGPDNRADLVHPAR
jgi:DNA/RNA endonuclease G (NUC1)